MCSMSVMLADVRGGIECLTPYSSWRHDIGVWSGGSAEPEGSGEEHNG